MNIQKKGFTLIELLVVIAIIAILAAILFPVFAQAKSAAKKTADLSNVKQIGTGIIMYEADYDDFYPRGTYKKPEYAPAIFSWREATQPYIKSDQKGEAYSNGQPRARGGIWRSPAEPGDSINGYGAHNALMPATAENWYQGPSPELASRSQGSLNRPANTLLVTTQGLNPDWNNSGGDLIETDWWFHGGEQWPPVFTGATSGSKYEGDGTAYEQWGMPRYRYTQSANVVWADGHAKAVKKGALNWCTQVYAGFTHVPAGRGDQNYDWLFTPGNSCEAYANQ
jgi:prepilin-type N-terminal cleavage/methylation domain-containing protein/prepilin-type processing-associated H-X9-DG protein